MSDEQQIETRPEMPEETPAEGAAEAPNEQNPSVGQVAGLPAAAEQESLLPQMEEGALKAAVEAIVYAAEEPATAAQIAAALKEPEDRVARVLEALVAEYAAPEHGVMIRALAGGYKAATKPEHHDSVRAFIRSLKPPLKLSLAALETLAAIAYKQPVTGPEIMAIRGVQGAGVLNTLIERKLIKAAGRKNVIGRPILYRTTREFLMQFGLRDLSELPTLKEFEELRRLAMDEPAPEAESAEAPASEPPATEPPATEMPASEPPATESQPTEPPETEPQPQASGEPEDPKPEEGNG